MRRNGPMANDDDASVLPFLHKATALSQDASTVISDARMDQVVLAPTFELKKAVDLQSEQAKHGLQLFHTDRNNNFSNFTNKSACTDSNYGSYADISSDYSTHEQNFVLLFNFWMLGVIMPLIAVFGILANGASIVVLTRPFMRSSTINIYLAGLSAFDGLLLLMSLLLYPPLSFCELDHTDPSSPWCQYFFYSALFTYPLSLIMQSCSVWTLCAITVDRFVAINWPLRSRDWCTCRRAYGVLAAITAWSILYNLPAFFELTLKTIKTPPNTPSIDSSIDGIYNSTSYIPSMHVAEESQVVLEQTELRKQSAYKVAYKGYCYLFFMLLIPAGAMIVLNLFVTLRVRRAYKWRKATSGREEKERRCTIMAVLVVVMFLVFNSLAFANNMIEIFASTSGDEEPASTTKSTPYLLSVSIGNVLVALNSASNFVIYCALGGRFRNVFCKIFCSERCMPLDNGPIRYAPSGMRGRFYQSVAVRYSPQEKTDKNRGDYPPHNGSSRLLQMRRDLIHLDPSLDDLALSSNGSHEACRRSVDSTTSGLSHRYV